ncbi:MAG: 1,6-anhydro-N-acetylmuramyl-L-alanine amidase AmpD [Steroidobacteraceae bacterium]
MDFRVDPLTGLVAPARQLSSPNQDERPAGTGIDLVVIHGISLPPGEFGGPYVEQLFTNCLPREVHPYFQVIADLRVSAHLLIRRDGEVVQFVPLHRRAWHAGAGCWEGRERCNDYSIGIELEGADEVVYEEAQYESLTGLLGCLQAAYPALLPARVVGHSDVAPGRKTDPGPAFDWGRVPGAAGGRARWAG